MTGELVLFGGIAVVVWIVTLLDWRARRQRARDEVIAQWTDLSALPRSSRDATQAPRR